MKAQSRRTRPAGGRWRDWANRSRMVGGFLLRPALLFVIFAAAAVPLRAAEGESFDFQPLFEENAATPARLTPLMADSRFETVPPAPVIQSVPTGGGYPHEEAFARPQDHIGTAPMQSMGGAWGDPIEMEWSRLAPHRKLGLLFTSPVHRQRFARLRMPMIGESWSYRPFSAGWFMGGMAGSPLISNWMGTGHGFLGGYRFGWDFDHYWGTEVRFSFSSMSMWDSAAAVAAQQAADDAAGLAPDDPWRNRYDGRRDANVTMFDLNLLYYPWGESAWRPYIRAGLGTVRTQCQDRLGTDYDSTVIGIPWGLGLKYRVFNWLALRGEIADNVAVHAGSSFNTQHNFSLTFAMEVRFGGSRVAYWPWNPGIHYW